MSRTYSANYTVPDPRDEPPKQWQCPYCLRVWERDDLADDVCPDCLENEVAEEAER